MDAPQLRVQLANVGILLNQWLIWELYRLFDKHAASFISSKMSMASLDSESMCRDAWNTQWILIQFMLIEFIGAHKIHCTE